MKISTAWTRALLRRPEQPSNPGWRRRHHAPRAWQPARLLAAGLLACGITATPRTANAALETERHTLENGVRLILSEQSAVPIVSIDCLVDGGARLDPPGQPGLAGLTADLLDEGTRQRSSQEIARRIDSLGGSFGTGASRDWIHAGAAVLSRDIASAFDLIGESLRDPTFPTDEIERVRRETLGALEASEEDPGTVAARTFRHALYGDTSYGYPIAGTPESVEKITREAIVGFHRRAITPQATICAVVGDATTAEMRAQAERTLGSWQSPREPEEPTALLPPQARTIRIDRELTQANLIIGQLGVARDNPDYFPILLMNHILGGGGFTSRLVEEIRTKEGLAYAVYSRFSSSRLPGSFRVVLQTKAESAGRAVALVRREIARMHEQGVTEAELSAAKAYLTGSFPLKLDSTAKLSSLLAQIEYFQLGSDYIEKYTSLVQAVTAEDVAAAARRHLRPEALIVVAVGPEAVLGGQNFAQPAAPAP